MSSTSFQIDQAKKLAELVESGEIEKAQALAGNVKKSAQEYQKSEQDKQSQSEILKNIDNDATIGGLNRENIKVVDDHRGVDPIHRREIAHLVGEHQEHSLKQQFLPVTERAEEQTHVKTSQMTTAERETQVPSSAGGDHDSDAVAAKVAGDKNQTTAAKETKVPKEQAKAEEKKQEAAHKDQDKTESKAAVKAAETGKPVGQDKSAVPGASKVTEEKKESKTEKSSPPKSSESKTEKSGPSKSSTETKTEKSDSGEVTKVTTVKKENK